MLHRSSTHDVNNGVFGGRSRGGIADGDGELYDYHTENIISEKKEQLCVAFQDLLTKSEVHPNDTVIDCVDVVHAEPPKAKGWKRTLLSWPQNHLGALTTLFALDYIFVAIGLSGSAALVLLVFALSIVGFFLYENPTVLRSRNVPPPERASVTIYFNATSQLFGRRDALDEVVSFLNAEDSACGEGRFHYGYDPIEAKCYITWVPPESPSKWMDFVKNGNPSVRTSIPQQAMQWFRYLVAPSSSLTVICGLLMLWSAMFLWRHWSGYSRPIDGVWRVSRHYFYGTPLAFLLVVL